jgi:hypothetical protein
MEIPPQERKAWHGPQPFAKTLIDERATAARERVDEDGRQT